MDKTLFEVIADSRNITMNALEKADQLVHPSHQRGFNWPLISESAEILRRHRSTCAPECGVEMTIWVLTEEYNDYDQHGEYFVYAWNHKPSRAELMQYIDEMSRPYREDYIGFVLDGGGRYTMKNYDDNQWYILKEIR